jgi:tetratricopeptide (TPR) repeat protein
MILFSSFACFSQQNDAVQAEVYAIVVGISKYHYIKPLNYADRDADLFSELLRSGVGGHVKPENLFLLKNDSANAGNFWSAISRISNKQLKKGDRVYIYFAGHGDAVKGLNEYYLLLSDCQPANDGNNYLLSFGAIDMYHLKNRIGLLTGRGVEVILILDACRTNELVGGYASQVFNSSIIQTRVGEITMLATGPGQISIEDASFGNGHGLFTYNLIDALSGRADNEEGGNQDQVTSLDEINPWVTKYVKLMSEKFHTAQSPVFCCDEKNKVTIGVVDSSFSLTWNKLKQLNNTNNPLVIPASKTQRGNDLVVDTALLTLYNKFNEARKQNNLWGDNSANSYYDQMEARFRSEQITEDARYMLASDFINFAQQKINLYLEGKDLLSLEIMREKIDSSNESELLADQYDRLMKTLSEKWTIAGMMVEKAGKLLSSKGDSSFLKQLKPKIFFLLARGYVNEEKENTLSFAQALQYANETYRADSTAAYAAECLGLLYDYRLSSDYHFRYNPEESFSFGRRSDSAFYFFKKAMLLAPAWVNPYRSMALKIYGEDSKDTAMAFMRKAISVNPRDGSTYILIGDLLRYYFENADSSIYYYRLAITMTPKSAHADIYCKMGARFFRPYGKMFTFKLDSVTWYSQKSLSIDSNNIGAYMNLARLYERLKKPDSALPYYLKIMGISPDYQSPYVSINRYYAGRNMTDSVFFYSKKLLHADPKNSYASLMIGDYYEKKGANRDSAIFYYQISLQSNFPNNFSRERLAYLLMNKNKNDTAALGYFTYMLNKAPLSWRQYYNIACYYSNQGNTEKAVEFLEKAFGKGFRNYKQVNEDPYLDHIRNSEGFKRLMEKHFRG